MKKDDDGNDNDNDDDEKVDTVVKSVNKMYTQLFNHIEEEKIKVTLPVFMFVHLTYLKIDRFAMCFWITQEKVKQNTWYMVTLTN